METKSLDFYQHETNCSLKCQSRNYIKNRKSETMESMLDSMVPSAGSRESRSSNENNDENGYDHQRKRSSVLDEYVSQTIQSLNNNPLTRLIKTDDHHIGQHHGLKADDQLSHTTTSGGNSTTPSVSSPPSSHHLIGHATVPDFSSTAVSAHTHGNLAAPTVQNPATSQILHHLLEQQILVHQQPQPQQTLLNNLIQAINKSQNSADTNALVQMAMVAMQMNANQQQQAAQPGLTQPQPTPAMGNIVQQLLIAQTMNAAQNGFALPTQQIPPYLNDSMFSVGSIRRVMDEEPTLFWRRMKEVGVLDELLGLITMAVDRIHGLYSKRDSTGDEEEFGMYLNGRWSLNFYFSCTSSFWNGESFGSWCCFWRKDPWSICSVSIDLKRTAE